MANWSLEDLQGVKPEHRRKMAPFDRGLEAPTIASGVLTVTKFAVDPQPESGTTDTVDSIVWGGFGVLGAGDMLFIHIPADNTITFDDAVINLASGTRAVAPGGSLLLIYDGTQWSEMFFTAATNNT